MAPDVEWASEKVDDEPLSTRFVRWRHNQLLLTLLTIATLLVTVAVISGTVLYFQLVAGIHYLCKKYETTGSIGSKSARDKTENNCKRRLYACKIDSVKDQYIVNRDRRRFEIECDTFNSSS
ncbi:hypothetical protein AVEN_252177-1 [Araneus ventricosus]|uniref:Uncharacterized protein n=1 Tax=Araneus ventricosus TaxID=182803 RepID=A0A4Y2N0C2_ARAVE|nr:hypothetical protein AVEN_252177-1 [Araneus ventricosus]